ncbi:hypothetical protein LEM8419_00990 [Neolewinella maritima]|uniref:Uncharacterized protein n=1 Tax=Neolewinella maritima TaxID=1383882 RepID=A0ABM9AYI4_9BACT|nr:hypothetical protein [Neolewinella maritima]CAH0999690.1 hypothetical protein LEM8419_00990 [Neolewinella maritima]
MMRGIWSLLLLLLALSCGSSTNEVPRGERYLYITDLPGQGPLRHADVLERRGDKVAIRSLLGSRDTTISLTPGSTLSTLATAGELIALREVASPLDTSFLTSHPFTYRYLGEAYWASFEPTFTGFPEYARAGSRDFVNHLMDWQGTGPGLQYSEYTLPLTEPQPVLVLSERRRSEYLDNALVLVDSVGTEAFSGRLIEGAEVHPVTFERVAAPPLDYTAAAFVDEVNAGYSRSFLLVPEQRNQEAASTVDAKRLPRRSLIDPGDLGNISASFLDDGTVMFLSNDHIVLQGSYVLDLDKGLLTVADDTDAAYRIFVHNRESITFTLPVSVVQLDGNRLLGTDNYLRIEVAP